MSSDAAAILALLQSRKNRAPRNARGVAAELKWIRDGEGSRALRVNERRACLAMEELERLGHIEAMMTGAGQRWKLL